jgi:hypothetical protein
VEKIEPVKVEKGKLGANLINIQRLGLRLRLTVIFEPYKHD